MFCSLTRKTLRGRCIKCISKPVFSQLEFFFIDLMQFLNRSLSIQHLNCQSGTDHQVFKHMLKETLIERKRPKQLSEIINLSQLIKSLKSLDLTNESK